MWYHTGALILNLILIDDAWGIPLFHKVSFSVHMIMSLQGWFKCSLFFPFSRRFYIMLLLLGVNPISQQCTSLIARVCLSSAAFIKVFQVCTMVPRWFPISKDLHGWNLVQVSLQRDKPLLDGDAIITCRPRAIKRKCEPFWPLHPGIDLFMKVCKYWVCCICCWWCRMEYCTAMEDKWKLT